VVRSLGFTPVTAYNGSDPPSASSVPGGLYVGGFSIVGANGGTTLTLYKQTQCWFSDVWFSGASVVSYIDITACNKLKFTNFEINAATQGFYFRDVANFALNDIVISNGTFAMSSGNKLWSTSIVNAAFKRIALSNCTVTGTMTYDPLLNEEQPTGFRGLNRDRYFAQGNVTRAVTFDREAGHTITVTLLGNITVTLTNGQTKGDTLTLILTQDSTGSRTATWPATFKKAGGSLTLSTAAGATDTIRLVWTGSNWNEVSRSLNVS
jgi:hypothetical protein